MLFFMDIGTREVRLGGIVKDPNGNWSTQIARNMCDMWDGFLLGKRYLIHDRDPVFNKRFDMIFESIGIEIKKLPPFTPMMNSRMENFIRAIKTECLDKIIFTNELQLRFSVKNIWSIGITTAPTQGLTEIWYCRIRRMQTVRYRRFHFSAVCFTVIAEFSKQCKLL